MISFHSLEDRIVKSLPQLGRTMHLSAGLPVCMCGENRNCILTKKAVLPSEAEKQANPSAPARLRAAGAFDEGSMGKGGRIMCH